MGKVSSAKMLRGSSATLHTESNVPCTHTPIFLHRSLLDPSFTHCNGSALGCCCYCYCSFFCYIISTVFVFRATRPSNSSEQYEFYKYTYLEFPLWVSNVCFPSCKLDITTVANFPVLLDKISDINRNCIFQF